MHASRRVFAAFRLLCIAALLTVPPSAAVAQDYPSKPTRVLIGAPAGSLMDIVTRMVATRMSEKLGQPYVVENRPGASGNIAAEAVARSAPDGYTLMIGANNVFVVNPSVYPQLGYDPVKDFESIMLMAKVSEVLVVSPTLGAKTVEDFVRVAKASPGRFTYASGGPGSPQHLMMELLQARAGMQLVHVPYKGPSLAMQALASGEVHALNIGIGLARPHIASGKVIALARTGQPSRDAYPELPPLTQIYPDIQYAGWFAAVAPKGTPREIIAKLNAEMGRVLAEPEIVSRMTTMDLAAIAGAPSELDRTVQSETPMYRALVKAINLKMD